MMAVVVVAVLAAIGTSVWQSGQRLDTVISTFTTRFLGIFIEAVPFLLLGAITSGLIEAFVRPDDLVRFMPRNAIAATVLGAFMGLAFPVCECGVVPVTRRLFSKGLPISAGIAFLLAAPFMNPIVFASTYLAFGFGTVFIGRFIITAMVAILTGFLLGYFARPEQIVLPQILEAQQARTAVPEPRLSLRQGLPVIQNVAIDEFFEMGRYMVIGCLLASAMQSFVPQETLLSLGNEPVISVLVMQFLAFVLSICSTVDSFLALAFVSTFTIGSILAFLSFGPMVDIKSTTMFLGVFRRRIVFYLILIPFLLNLCAGIWVNLFAGNF